MCWPEKSFKFEDTIRKYKKHIRTIDGDFFDWSTRCLFELPTKEMGGPSFAEGAILRVKIMADKHGVGLEVPRVESVDI